MRNLSDIQDKLAGILGWCSVIELENRRATEYIGKVRLLVFDVYDLLEEEHIPEPMVVNQVGSC